MPIKLANNARAHLAAPLAADGDTIVLVTEEAATFPALSPGDWFPLTLCDADGNIEIARVTARSGNLLTATRAQENTTARDWIAGDRAEIRFTSGVIDAMRQEQSEAIAAAQAAAIEAAREPVGTMKLWSRATPPAGWIIADGRTLLADTEYLALRAAYIADGFPWGKDASDNPKVPDLRGRVAAGVDAGAARLTGGTLGATLGAQTHTLTTGEMPTHAHAVTDPAHNHGVNDPTHAHSVYDPGHAHSASQDGHTHDPNIGRKSKRSDSELAGTYGLQAGSGTFSGRILIDNGADSATGGASANGVYVGASGTGIGIYGAGTGIWLNASGTGISIQNNGSGQAHNNVQPTLVANYIVKAT